MFCLNSRTETGSPLRWTSRRESLSWTFTTLSELSRKNCFTHLWQCLLADVVGVTGQQRSGYEWLCVWVRGWNSGCSSRWRWPRRSWWWCCRSGGSSERHRADAEGARLTRLAAYQKGHSQTLGQPSVNLSATSGLWHQFATPLPRHLRRRWVHRGQSADAPPGRDAHRLLGGASGSEARLLGILSSGDISDHSATTGCSSWTSSPSFGAISGPATFAEDWLREGLTGRLMAFAQIPSSPGTSSAPLARVRRACGTRGLPRSRDRCDRGTPG